MSGHTRKSHREIALGNCRIFGLYALLAELAGEVLWLEKFLYNEVFDFHVLIQNNIDSSFLINL